MRIVRLWTGKGGPLWAEEREGRYYRLSGDLLESPRSTSQEVRPESFLPPVIPPNIIALGLNYRDHAAETSFQEPKEPQFFLKATSSLAADGAEIVLPTEAPDEVDFEAELALVIGAPAKDVSPAEAPRHILGYLCANDVSARDCQMRRDLQWARGKSFDTFCPVGRTLVTDLDSRDLAIRCLVNGEVLQDSRTSYLIFDPWYLVSYLSRQMTLLPGTLILTGTPGGVGFMRTPPRFLRPGDRVTVEIEGLGRLENPVRAAREEQTPGP